LFKFGGKCLHLSHPFLKEGRLWYIPPLERGTGGVYYFSPNSVENLDKE